MPHHKIQRLTFLFLTPSLHVVGLVHDDDDEKVSWVIGIPSPPYRYGVIQDVTRWGKNRVWMVADYCMLLLGSSIVDF